MFRSRLSPCLCSELTGQMPQGKQSCSFACSITKTRKPKTFHPASLSSKLCNPLTFSSVKQTLGYITTSPHTAALFFQETQESHLVFSWSHSQLLHFLCWGKIRQESFLKHCYSRSDGLSPAGLSSTQQRASAGKDEAGSQRQNISKGFNRRLCFPSLQLTHSS